MKYNNNYYILRHGESVANVEDIHSCWPEKFYSPLTNKGIKEAEAVAKRLKKKNIDLIFSSDILRTKQTAVIIAKELNLEIKYDPRLREVNIGIFNAKPLSEFRKFFPKEKINKRFKEKPEGGETYTDVRNRMHDFLKDKDKKYKSRNILIISHQAPLILIESIAKNIPNSQVFKVFTKTKRIKTGELRKII
jgi:broad specificity phosphatase PhoE